MLKAIYEHARSALTACVDSDGILAPLAKTVPVLAILAFAAYPFWSFPLWLALSRSVSVAMQYVVYALWGGHYLAMAVVAATVRYIREDQ